MKKLLLLILLCASVVSAQGTGGKGGWGGKGGFGGGASTQVLFPGGQYVQDETVVSCPSTRTTCTAGVGSWGTSPFGMFSTTAGSTGVISVGFGVGTAETITSAYLCTNSGGCNSGNATATFIVPSSGCAGFSSTLGYGQTCAYYLNGPASGTYITVNVNSTGSQGWGFTFTEHSPPSGYSESFYQAGQVAGGCADTCSTCTGGAPTSSATPLDVIEYNNVNPSSVDLPATGYGYGSQWIFDTFTNGLCFDNTCTTPPSFTFSGGGTGTVWTWIAFKLNANYTVQAPISIVQHVANGTVHNCSPTCTLTINSTGSGNLLRLFALTNSIAPVSYISTVSDGTTSFTVPSACQSANASGNSQSSCADLLSSNSGKTSLSITMTANAATTYFSFWELSKSGTWTQDTGGPQCTLNGTGTYTPSGQALTLNNTTTPHAIFQSIVAEGGLGGVTLFPWIWNDIANSQGYSGGVGPSTASGGADVLLLNTKNGSAPTWSTAEENTITTGVCAEAFY